MSYKTFTIRGGTSGWGNGVGNQVTLYGKFYGQDTTKTFRNIDFVVLTERMPTKESIKRYGPSYLFVQADRRQLDQAIKSAQQQRANSWDPIPELTLKGKNKTVDIAYFADHYVD